MSREQELTRLRQELAGLRPTNPLNGKPFDDLELIAQAAARLGMYPSYAYRLLREQERGSAGFRSAKSAAGAKETFREQRRA